MGRYEEGEISRLLLKVRALFADKERTIADRMLESWHIVVNSQDESELNTNLEDRARRVFMMEMDRDVEKWCEALRIAKASKDLLMTGQIQKKALLKTLSLGKHLATLQMSSMFASL